MGSERTPWWRNGVVYQVYPRSFGDSDGDGVGDLAGVTARLDHLVDLGVDAVWLSPFYRSPMADFGYDVSDHTDVDPTFGTLADADELIARGHELGLRVIFDWVPNHTSDRQEWFIASLSSREDPKRSWYVWRDPRPGGRPPSNWTSAFSLHGTRPSWTFDERTGQFYLHSFLPEQPDLNWDDPAVPEAMQDVLRFWLERGVDGFRIDVAHVIGKDPELGDNEPGRRHDEDWPSVHPRLRAIRRVLEEYDGDRIAVGEVYLLDQTRLAPYVRTGDELHLRPQLRVPQPALVGRALPRDGGRVRAAGGARRLAGMVPRKPGRGRGRPRPGAGADPLGASLARGAGRGVHGRGAVAPDDRRRRACGRVGPGARFPLDALLPPPAAVHPNAPAGGRGR